MNKEHYSTTEAAKIFRVSRKTIFKWIQLGKLKGNKVGRNYIIPQESITERLGKKLSAEKKAVVDKAVDKAIEDYGEVFRKLGKE